MASVVHELEPLQPEALAGCSGDESTDAGTDAGHAVADVLDVHQGADAVAVAGSCDLDSFDRQGAPRRSDRDRRASAARALARLPADRRHMGIEADHLVAQLRDPDRLDAQALASSSRLRRPAHVLNVRGDLEVLLGFE